MCVLVITLTLHYNSYFSVFGFDSFQHRYDIRFRTQFLHAISAVQLIRVLPAVCMCVGGGRGRLLFGVP